MKKIVLIGFILAAIAAIFFWPEIEKKYHQTRNPVPGPVTKPRIEVKQTQPKPIVKQETPDETITVEVNNPGMDLFLNGKEYRDQAKTTLNKGIYPVIAYGTSGFGVDLIKMEHDATSFSVKTKPENVQDNWFQDQGTAEKQGFYTEMTQPSGKVSWKHDTGDRFESSPVCDANAVYAAGKSGKVYAFSLDTGKKIWSREIAPQLHGSPVLWNGFLIQSTPSGNLVPIKTKKGKVQELFPCESHILGTTLSGNRLILWTSAGDVLSIKLKLTRFKSLKMKEAWRVSISNDPESFINEGSVPVVSSSKVFVQTSKGRIIALNTDNGQIQWDTVLDTSSSQDKRIKGNSKMSLSFAGDELDRFTPIPAHVHGHLLCGFGSYLYCINEKNGSVIWKKDLRAPVSTAISSAYDLVFAGTANGVFHCLTVDGGIPVYQESLSSEALVLSPLINKMFIITGDAAGALYRIHTFLGRQTQVAHLGAILPRSTLAPAHGQLFVPGKKGTFWSLK